jgi:hypothetical protein
VQEEAQLQLEEQVLKRDPFSRLLISYILLCVSLPPLSTFEPLSATPNDQSLASARLQPLPLTHPIQGPITSRPYSSAITIPLSDARTGIAISSQGTPCCSKGSGSSVPSPAGSFDLLQELEHQT